MAFTPAEEARLRALMNQDTSLLTLATNEPAIIQELGAQDVTIDELQLATSIIDSDKLLGRFGGEDKTATMTAIRAAILGNFLNQLKYGCPLIGMRVDWPLQQMPQEIWPDCKMEFIPYIAQAFDGVKFPLLKQLHPSGVLPADMRGEFPRGWDNGRGVDSGRVLMSAQGDAMRNITATVQGNLGIGAFSGAFEATESGPNNLNGGTALRTLTFDASKVVPTGPEFRSRSIAWNMIVRAV